MKEFKPRIKEVNSLGEELRFQREYYCFKNNVSLPLKIDSTDKEKDEQKSLQDVLYDFMKENIGDNSELATSYDVLYAIENGKSKKKGEKYNPNTYFLRIFCLLKIYGFLDSLRILELLIDKYKLETKYDSSDYIILDIGQENSVEELLKKGQKEKILKINIAAGRIWVSKEAYLKNCNEEERKEIMKMYDEWKKEDHYKETYSYGKLVKKEKIENPDDCFMFGYIFKNEIVELQKEMKKLSKIERYTLSLDFGEPTSYIPSFINGTLQNIHIDTLLKTLNYFGMGNSKFYNKLLEITKNLDKESLREIEVL